jgi:hypothetical protein
MVDAKMIRNLKNLFKQYGNLRDEIRQDMQDYKLLHTKGSLWSELNMDWEDNSLLFIGWYTGEDNCFDKNRSSEPKRAFSDQATWYKEHLEKRLKQNLIKLKEVEEELTT